MYTHTHTFLYIYVYINIFEVFHCAQVLATLGCLVCTNPVWPLLIMFPIQLASLLMTLVRKGLLSARGGCRPLQAPQSNS